jgi:small-conductance mechanosensitive channel
MDWNRLGVDRVIGLHLVWTAVTVAGAYLLGHLVNVLLLGRLARLAARTKGRWDDIVLDEFRRRIPFWSVLAGASLALSQWSLSPHALAFSTGTIRALAILSFTVLLSSIVTRLIASYGHGAAPDVPVSALTQNIARLVIIVLGLLVIARDFGFEITPYLAALGVGGLAVALALQDPLSNLFGGVFMSLSGHMHIGDYVKVDTTVEGYVLDFDWRTTRLRTLADNIVTVPNAKLAQSVVVNFSRPSTEVSVGIDLIVDYSSDLAKVERVTTDVAHEVLREVAGGVRGADAAVRFQTFGPSGITFSIGLKGQVYTDQFLLKHEFVKRLHARYAQEGIAFGAPLQRLTTRDPIHVQVLTP